MTETKDALYWKKRCRAAEAALFKKHDEVTSEDKRGVVTGEVGQKESEGKNQRTPPDDVFNDLIKKSL